jgi:hypothetical protein
MSSSYEPSRDRASLQELMAAHLKETGRWYGSWSEYEFRGPLTVEEIEQETLQALAEEAAQIKGRRDVPQMPFGFANSMWIDFTKEYRRGDELYFFTTVERSWAAQMGSEGYLLLRKDKVVRTIITVLN